MTIQSPWQTIRRSAHEYGVVAVDWLTSAAEMLAALRLLRDDAETLVERDTELTAAEWAKVRDRADQIWRASHVKEEPEATLASPFAQALDAKRWPPGYFEHLRLAVYELDTAPELLTEPHGPLALVFALLEAAGDNRNMSWLPREVGQLVMILAGKGPPATAYCAFEGAAFPALMLGSAGCKVLLEIPNAQTASFWSALAIASLAEVTVQVAEPFDRLPTTTTHEDILRGKINEVAIVVPPTGAMSSELKLPQYSNIRSSSEVQGVALAALMGLRKGVCVVLNGFLYRSSMADQEFKRMMIGQGLETVVSLPAGTAGVGFNLSASIIVLDRLKLMRASQAENSQRGVFMVDATNINRARRGFSEDDKVQVLALIDRRENGEMSRLVSIDELAKNDFNFLPARYVLSDEAAQLADLLSHTETVGLGDLVEIYRPQPSPRAVRKMPGSTESNPGGPKELVVSDLSDLGTASSPSKHLQVSQAELHRLRRAELQPGDIVLVTKGSVGRVGLIQQIPDGETWVANQSFAILRLRRAGPIRSSTVLFRYLNSRMGQELLHNLKVGAALPTLQMADLKRLPVIVPNEAVQEQVIEQMDRLFEVQAIIDDLRREQTAMQARIWPETLL